MRKLVLACVVAMSAAGLSGAQESGDKADVKAASETEKPIPDPVLFETTHSGTFNGTRINYRVEAGETYIKNDEGEPAASLFTMSYIKADAGPDRPVAFVFNGGPGSASVWLHLGLLGPKRAVVASNADADDGAAPYRLEDNPRSLLDVTDLVFVDPVGTGFSHAIGKGEGKDYWNEEGDKGSIGEFIRLWLNEHGRWNAPKYLIGESFGTTRAAYLAEDLATGDVDIALNGLLLISQALDYEGSTSVHDNVYSYITYLPSMAAAAQYHGRAGQGVPQAEFLADARAFARDEYGPALLKGAGLSEAEHDRIRDRLAYFTGLDPVYIERSDLRILMPRFQKELLRDQGLAIGRLDGRYAGDEADDVAERPDGDAASYFVSSAYSALMNQYLLDELKVKMDRPYITSSDEVGEGWRFGPEDGSGEPHYVNAGRQLTTAMRRNTALQVWVANGYYDMITPFFDAEITFARYGIPQDRVTMSYYPAGHMMYLHEPSLDAVAGDMRAFLKGDLEDARP